MSYLITFACYGCHLHGDGSGSVDRSHNVPGTPILEEDPERVAFEERRMDQRPYYLDQIRRGAVLKAIQEVCAYRGWKLLAAQVRTNHVHTVVEAEAEPERVMRDLKVYASRYFNRAGLDEPNRKRWGRHGSTRWLWKPQHVSAAVQYVVDEQGDAGRTLPYGRGSDCGAVQYVVDEQGDARRTLPYGRGSDCAALQCRRLCPKLWIAGI